MRFAVLAVFVVACACECGEAPIDPPGRTPCRFNSDCGDGAHCAIDGHCAPGLAPGTCLADTDCDDGFLCVKPDGSDVGACLDQNECATDDDCDDGRVCRVDEDTGFRVCLFEGCEDDDECDAEIGATCTPNEEARCIARACRCQDLCGAPCGEDQQCCASPGQPRACIEDPGPCKEFPCDPGFAGATDAPGEWLATSCSYPTAVCDCRELPPLHVGDVGSPHVLLEGAAGARFVVSYARAYGDVVVADATTSPVGPWRAIAGVPAGAPIVAGPSGFRGGVSEPGDDVGRMLDAALAPDGTLHVVARDDTNEALVHVSGPPAGPFTTEVLDDTGDPGFWPALTIDGDGRLLVAHVARRTAGGDSEVRLLAQPTAGAAPSSWQRHVLRTFDVPVDGGVGDAELALDRLDLAGTASAFAVFGHDARVGSLVGVRLATGDPTTASATFASRTIVGGPDAGDVGANPAAAALASGYRVAYVDEANRAVLLATLSATLTLQTTLVVDDGLRAHPSGAIDDHAVDLPALALRPDGSGVVAWQDGTDGSLRARDVVDGGLGPSQVLAGGRLASVYEGTYALGASAVAKTDVVVSSKRALLDPDPARFDVLVFDGPLGCPADDPGEDDDLIAAATLLATGDVASAIVCAADDDFFSVAVGAGCTLTAELLFRDVDGDLDMQLRDPQGAVLDTSAGIDEDREVAATTPTAATSVFVRVYGYQDAVNAYVLRVDVACP